MDTHDVLDGAFWRWWTRFCQYSTGRYIDYWSRD